MSIKRVRFKKIEIFRDHFHVVYIIEPRHNDIIYIQRCLEKKNVAKITFEKNGKEFEEELKRIEYDHFMTESNDIYSYR